MTRGDKRYIERRTESRPGRTKWNTVKNLSATTLAELNPEVSLPGYLDARPRVGLAHIGVGNFHRSHQAMYLDRLLSADPALPWAICGVGMREEDRGLATALAEQDYLYSLSLLGSDGTVESSVIASIREFILAPDAPERALARLSDPSIRIVSLTITESGYVEDPANHRAAATDPAILADIADGLASPRSAFGLLVAALRARRDAGDAPFTVMSCDNIQNNGAVARASVVATARLVSDELAAWIEENVSFPSTMVDRITPRATPEQRDVVDRTLGVHDAAAVVAEPFEQWVIEDDFRSGRPAFDEVGAVFVDDIDAYESMKLRLLNGAHQVMAYVGSIAGHTFVHEAMDDPWVAYWVEAYSRRLALPTVDLPDGVDGNDYISVLDGRFRNPAIADTLERLATDSGDRMAKFVLPVLLDARSTPVFREIAPTILASWAVTIARTSSPVILESVSDDVLRAVRSEEDPAGFLASVDWLEPLSADAELRDAVAEAVTNLRAGRLLEPGAAAG